MTTLAWKTATYIIVARLYVHITLSIVPEQTHPLGLLAVGFVFSRSFDLSKISQHNSDNWAISLLQSINVAFCLLSRLVNDAASVTATSAGFAKIVGREERRMAIKKSL